MIVSHEWLKQFVPHDLSAEAVGEALSRHCVTLDGLERLGADLSAFVVAQVVEAGRHPNSDHLWVTKVDDGSGTLLDVVCGAPNVVAGCKYPFARTGTIMPGGLKIEKRKIRGETSNGMLCSPRELGLGEEHDGIMTLDTAAVPGTALLAVLAVADARLDLDVLPNRPDLLSHRGVARELAAITGVPCSLVPREDFAATPFSGDSAQADNALTLDGVTVQLDDRASCAQYVAIVIRDVQIGASPPWLVRRLESIGQRSINNVVDATNYVLHGLGQPVHAFDLAKLARHTIVVRPTRDGESLVTLDGVERALPTGTTVICDADKPVAIAGVMGGRNSEVDATTTAVLLEVAAFEPRFVRRVRRALGLSTDASYRFERGIDAAALQQVARCGAALIAELAGGSVGPCLTVGAAIASRAPITLRVSRLHRLLGAFVAADEIGRRLTSLGCDVVANGDALTVTPPSWRHDLLREVDLIEEVARLVGFDALPDELRPFRPGRTSDHPAFLAGRRVRDVLVGMGLSEARPMPFTASGNEDSPRVRNPLADDEPYLRASILDTLARRAEYNLSRMQGNIRLFEVGSVFLASPGRLPREEVRVGALVMGLRRPPHFSEPQPPAFDLWDAKAIAEDMTAAVYPGLALEFLPGEGDCLWMLTVAGRGHVGRVERVTLTKPLWATDAFGIELFIDVMPSSDVAPTGQHSHGTLVARSRDASVDVRARSLPVTPAAEFDLALIVPDSILASTVESAMRSAGGDLLERITLFDEFRGGNVDAGSRSLAWRLTFRHPERTLKEKEIDGRRARLLETLDKELGIRPRAS